MTVSPDTGDLVLVYAPDKADAALEKELTSALAKGQSVLIDSDGSDAGRAKVAELSGTLSGMQVQSPMGLIQCDKPDSCLVTPLTAEDLLQVISPTASAAK